MEKQSLNKRLVRIALTVVLALVLVLPLQMTIEATPNQVAWLISWLVSFGVIADDNASLLTRGLLFLIISVALSMLGVAYAKVVKTEWVWLVEYIGQIMLLTGSGVGANFIAQHFLDKRKKI